MSQQYPKNAGRKKKYRKLKGAPLSQKQVMQVKKIVEKPVEKKYFDRTYDYQDVLITPTFTDLTNPETGIEPFNIVGSEMNLLSLQYKFFFLKPSTDETNIIRYIIFQWFPDNQNDLPQWAQIMQYKTGGSPSSTIEVMSPYVLGEGSTRNFKILVDEMFYLDADNSVQLVKGFINKGFRSSIEVDGPTQQGTGHVYLLFLSDSLFAGHPKITGYTRIRFTD